MILLILFVVLGLFVIGVALSSLGSRLKHPIAVAVNLLLIGSLFFLLNVGTTEPGRGGGNGNPGLILWIPLLAFGCVLLIQLYGASWLRRLGAVPLAAILLGLIAHQAVGFWIQRIRYQALRERMIETMMPPDNEASRIPIENWLSGIHSIHMGSHFFHLNTYLLFVGWMLMAAIVLILAKILLSRSAERNSNKKEF